MFCIAADRNGYIATHNKKYSHPQRGDLADALHSWLARNVPDRSLFLRLMAENALRNARVGWDSKLRHDFFSWFNTTAPRYQGGNSFKGYLKNARADAHGDPRSHPDPAHLHCPVR